LPDVTSAGIPFMTPALPRSQDRVPRRHASLLSAIAVAILLAPCVAYAQQPDTTSRPATHTVKKGDTLWDLARMYLGDPFLWPEIYRINTNVVEDPHWIYPGEVLRIPGGVGAVPAIVAEVNPSEQQQPSVDETPAETSGPTMFRRSPNRPSIAAQRGAATERSGRRGIDPAPAVRKWEYLAAPFVPSKSQRKDSGKIIASTEMTGIADARAREAVQPHERVYIRVPSESNSTIGDRYLAYRLGPDLPGVGQVIVPTAILIVEQPSNGDASVARVEHEFQDAMIGNMIMPLENFVSPPASNLQAIQFGAESKILWIMEEPALASLQYYLVVDLRLSDGVKMGDEFQLYRPREKTDYGDHVPAEKIATAKAVRVSEHSTTLIVTEQRHPAIQEGTRVRQMARMP
jgi:LysM repeat protein